jgi:hypothetical protein
MMDENKFFLLNLILGLEICDSGVSKKSKIVIPCSQIIFSDCQKSLYQEELIALAAR